MVRSDTSRCCVALIGLSLAAHVGVASATTRDVSCVGSITSQLQSAIDSSSDGDEVHLGAGTCSFAVSWTDKNISIIGAGTDQTLASTGEFAVTLHGAAKGKFRISGIGFSGTPGGNTVSIVGAGLTESVSGFRLDHLSFNYPNGSGDIVRIAGPIWGLIDHITMTYGGGYAVGIIMSDYLDSEYGNAPATFMGEYAARLPIDLGGPTAVYIEDSSFSLTGSTAYFPVLDSSSGGQRTVFRHNNVSGGLLYSHWTRGVEWDGHKYEIYGNTFDCRTPSAGPLYLVARLESGTGVIYDNTVTHCTDTAAIKVDEGRGCGGSKVSPSLDCDGTRAWDSNGGDTSAPGWPCMGQIGVGCASGSCARNSMDNVPLLLWNNGTEAGCASGGTCTNSVSVDVGNQDGDSADVCVRATSNYVKPTPHVASVAKYNGAIDYCVSATKPTTCGTYTNAYAPYPYPHPGQGMTPVPMGDAGVTGDASSGAQSDAGIDAGPKDTLGGTGCSCSFHAGAARSMPFPVILMFAVLLIRRRQRMIRRGVVGGPMRAGHGKLLSPAE